MLFNSLEFLIFFTVVYTAYLISNHRTQNILLVISSYVFYGAWDYRFLALIFASTVIDYGTGLAIHSSSVEKTRKFFLLVSIWANLGILGFFKYFDFFIESFEQLGERIGLDTSLPHWEIVLPVGISFYTFQTMSYSIDIYRRQAVPTRNFIDFALFVSFFPQLVAGPIERASRLLPQIAMKRTLKMEDIYEGAYLILWGFFLKIYVADNLGNIVDPIFAPGTTPTGAATLVGLYAFSFSAYGDFAGYSSMARGLAKCLGFDVMVNFNLPYLGGNPVEFWRRWHISMSTWLRDYVYIALGGSRKGELYTYRNMFTTMVVSGVWHGAGWNYIVWGAYQGLLLVVHRLLKPVLARITPANGTGLGRAYKVITVILFFHFIALGWPAFLCSTLSESFAVIGSLWSWETFTGLGAFRAELQTLAIIVTPLIILDVVCFMRNDLLYFYRAHWMIRAVFYYYLIICISLYGDYGGSEYFYFQF